MSNNLPETNRTMEEAQIYMKAGLVEQTIGGRTALVRTNIDWNDFACHHKWLKKRLADWERWQDYNNADLIGEGYRNTIIYIEFDCIFYCLKVSFDTYNECLQ